MAPANDKSTAGGAEADAQGLLDSWKEIATYLKRTVRTAQRWEKTERLPVHRHLHDRTGTVYGYESEIDAWLKKQRPLRGNTARRARARTRVCLAVLPFENLSGDPEQDYFSDGVTEEMIAQLGRVDPAQLGVIARTSVMRYKSTEKGIARIASDLGADYLIEGSVRRSLDRVRITAKLIQASDQTHLWAETYERPLADILSIQTEFAECVAQSLAAELASVGRLAPRRAPTPYAAAYEAYLKGRFYWNKRTEEGFWKAIRHFRQAIEIDRNYALAHAGLADCYDIAGLYSVVPPKEAYETAKEAAEKALKLDDRLAEAHASLAFAKLQYDWDWEGAEAEYLRSIELNTNYATAHHWYGLYLGAMGRFVEALAEMKDALQLDPLSLVMNSHVGWILYFAREFDQAIEQLRKTLEMEPNFPLARYFLGFNYEQKAQYTDAIAEFETASALTENHPGAVAGLGHAYALAGKRAEAHKQLKTLVDESKCRYVSPYFMALLHTGLGDKDQAFGWLHEAYEHRSGWLVHLKIEPALDPLRSDSRFAELVRRVGLRP